MTVEEYRQRMINAFHNADCDNLIALVALPTKKEFEHLEWLLKNHYLNQKQETCDDAISRQAVDELSKELVHTTRDKADFLCNFWEGLQKLPPVTPKEKTGRWISFGIQGEIDGQIVRAFTCSKCGAISIFRVSNGNIVNGDLCPNCGARMVEPQESEE